LRLPAERQYESELEALKAAERGAVPDGWKMSPSSVYAYIVGGEVNGTKITPKYIGNSRLVQVAIATLMTDRGLLLTGEPGTAKSRLSEHLAAAVSGCSSLVVQGSMGTTEEQVRYSWNYATLIASGPSEGALVKTPIYKAMEEGLCARFEELSRCAPETQDALISMLSEKCIAVPELRSELRARRGFSLIATSNTRDRGTNDMSAALARRFNTVVLPSPATFELEMEIVTGRVAELCGQLRLPAPQPGDRAVAKAVTVLRELRTGATLDGREKLRSPLSSCSAAETISLLTGALAFACGFGDGEIRDEHLASYLRGSAVKDEEKDGAAWKEYLENIMRKRGGEWQELYKRASEQEN
jgi:MoxR-like ATPase